MKDNKVCVSTAFVKVISLILIIGAAGFLFFSYMTNNSTKSKAGGTAYCDVGNLYTEETCAPDCMPGSCVACNSKEIGRPDQFGKYTCKSFKPIAAPTLSAGEVQRIRVQGNVFGSNFIGARGEVFPGANSTNELTETGRIYYYTDDGITLLEGVGITNPQEIPVTKFSPVYLPYLVANPSKNAGYSVEIPSALKPADIGGKTSVKCKAEMIITKGGANYKAVTPILDCPLGTWSVASYNFVDGATNSSNVNTPNMAPVSQTINTGATQPKSEVLPVTKISPSTVPALNTSNNESKTPTTYCYPGTTCNGGIECGHYAKASSTVCVFCTNKGLYSQFEADGTTAVSFSKCQ